MIFTGIVRRIDDLGRIVIPKDIRKRLEIKEGDAFSLYIDGKDIVFKKYNPEEVQFENSQTRLKNEMRENEEKIELLTNENEYIKEAMNNNQTEYWIKSKKED